MNFALLLFCWGIHGLPLQIKARDMMASSPLVCLNGGAPNTDGTACVCPLPYAGSTCERIMRDCKEGLEHGHTADENGVYPIQPVGAQESFYVECTFDYGGLSTVYSHTDDVMWELMDYAKAVDGFGDDLSVNPSSQNYFIGLANLHLLLAQAESNTLRVFIFYNNGASEGRAFFDNFTVDAKSEDFRLNYDLYSTDDAYPADNGFAYFISPQHVYFETFDHLINNCAESKPGWYDPQCETYNLFGNPPTWPVGGEARQLTKIIAKVTRQSGDFIE